MRRLILLHLFLFLLIACTAVPTPAPVTDRLATPTLLGTVSAVTRLPPTLTPQPPTCIFRTGPDTEFGLYRFTWDNATFTLDTKLGPLIVDGPRTLTPGPRQLLLFHNVTSSPAAGFAINFDVGGTLLWDPAHGAQEVRDAGGTAFIQTLTDPTGDANGLPPYLDIIRLERTFGYYPNSIVRVYLAGVRTAPQIWTFQSIGLTLGGSTFTRQSFADGRIAHTQTDGKGPPTNWPGPVTVADNVVSFALQTGVGDAVGAFTATSGGAGDTVGPYPLADMQAAWDAAKKSCP